MAFTLSNGQRLAELHTTQCFTGQLTDGKYTYHLLSGSLLKDFV